MIAHVIPIAFSTAKPAGPDAGQSCWHCRRSQFFRAGLRCKITDAPTAPKTAENCVNYRDARKNHAGPLGSF